MTRSTTGWPVAIATHAARDLIGSGIPWPEAAALEGFLADTRVAGFDGVDVSTSVFDVFADDARWRDLADAHERHELRIASINCLRSSLADPDHWQIGMDRVRRAIEVADGLGIPSVNVSLAVPPERLDANAFRQRALPPGSSRVASSDDFERTADRLRALRDLARSTRVVVELHHCSIADTAPSTLRLLELVGGGVTANPDLVNELWAFDTVHADWRQTLERLAPLTASIWHVKNCRREDGAGGVRFVDAPLQDGDIDYDEAIRIMLGHGFDGWLSIERSGPGDFRTGARRGLGYLRRALSLPTFPASGPPTQPITTTPQPADRSNR